MCNIVLVIFVKYFTDLQSQRKQWFIGFMSCRITTFQFISWPSYLMNNWISTFKFFEIIFPFIHKQWNGLFCLLFILSLVLQRMQSLSIWDSVQDSLLYCYAGQTSLCEIWSPTERYGWEHRAPNLETLSDS